MHACRSTLEDPTYRDVAANLDRLQSGLARLQRLGLSPLRKWLFRDLYRRHDFRVKTALAQLGT